MKRTLGVCLPTSFQRGSTDQGRPTLNVNIITMCRGPRLYLKEKRWQTDWAQIFKPLLACPDLSKQPQEPAAWRSLLTHPHMNKRPRQTAATLSPLWKIGHSQNGVRKWILPPISSFLSDILLPKQKSSHLLNRTCLYVVNHSKTFL